VIMLSKKVIESSLGAS